MTMRMHLSRMFALAVLACAMPGAVHAQAAKNRALDAALLSYQLTMPKIDAFVVAGTEIARAFKGRTPPDLGDTDAKTIDEMAAQYDAVPELRRAIRKAKLSTREYTTLSLVIMQAMMAESMMASYPNAERPANLSAANLAFVHANKAVLQKKLKGMQGAGR